VVSSPLSSVAANGIADHDVGGFSQRRASGANVASYKFALAKSILTLAESGMTSASLEDLAVPFCHELCEHLTLVDTQSTSSGSK
jgi:hypothetical protein